MSNTRRAASAPNSAIDTAGPQAKHRRIAHAAIVETRRPNQILKDSQQRTLADADIGVLSGGPNSNPK